MVKRIESIVMCIIAVAMLILFARTKATGSSNIHWIVIDAIVFAVVAYIHIRDSTRLYGSPHFKSAFGLQLTLTLSFTLLLIGQEITIRDGLVDASCYNSLATISLFFVICLFNIITWVIDFMDDNLDSLTGGVASVLFEPVIGILSICIAAVKVYYLLR